jgi:hypothetical protein
MLWAPIDMQGQANWAVLKGVAIVVWHRQLTESSEAAFVRVQLPLLYMWLPHETVEGSKRSARSDASDMYALDVITASLSDTRL